MEPATHVDYYIWLGFVTHMADIILDRPDEVPRLRFVLNEIRVLRKQIHNRLVN